MALDKIDSDYHEKAKPFQSSENYKSKMKRDKAFQTKVVVRRLPPSMTENQFLDQISPLPDHDFFYFVKGDLSLGHHAFSRAYINFLISEDIFIFKDKFDGYVFLDSKGNEYPAIVEFAPFQKIPKKRSKKRDVKSGTIFTDPDYLKFLEILENPEEVSLPSAETYLEEIELREKELKSNNGVPKQTTPLIEYLKARKIEQQKIREEKREERKRKDLEKKRIREEERRRRKAEKDKDRGKEKTKDRDSLSEKEVIEEIEGIPLPPESPKQSETVVQVLKNPEREKDLKEPPPQASKTKDFVLYRSSNKKFSKENERPKKEWDRTYTSKDRPRVFERTYKPSDKDRSRRDKTDYKVISCKKGDKEAPARKHKDEMSKGTEPTKSSSNTSFSKNSEDSATGKHAPEAQWSPKDKRDNSCPGNVETTEEDKEMTSRPLAKSSKSIAGDEETESNDTLQNENGGSTARDAGKDPRAERRIRNKDRPSLEIYRPGMRRFSTQRSSPQKEFSTSASNSSSSSPTPELTKSFTKEGDETSGKSATSPT